VDEERAVNGLLRGAPLLLALALAGCQTQWFLEGETSDIVETRVRVDTDPAGAWVSFNGVAQAKAPVIIPVLYDHTEQLWARQSNEGARMRDGMSTVVQIVTFPVWAVASLFHFREDKRRHVYGGNQHTVSAAMRGRLEAYQALELEGEAEVEVRLVLPPDTVEEIR
jgi:hypothetical protein